MFPDVIASAQDARAAPTCLVANPAAAMPLVTRTRAQGRKG